MNIPLHYIATMLMSMTAAAYLICAMVLWLGGWLNNERNYHSTLLQKYLSVSDIVSGLVIMLLVMVEGMTEGAREYCLIIADILCYIPFAMMYIESILLCQQRPGWKSWVHAFGLIIVGLPVVLIWGDTYPIVTMWTLFIIGIYLLILYVYSLHKLRQWDRQMREEFSDISHKQTAWFRHLTLPFIGLMLLWIPLYVWPEQEWITIVYYLISASLAIAMSSHALMHEEFDFDASVLQSTTDVEEVPAWADKLDKAMNEQHLYRQPELSLSNLAREIGVNRTYLSNYINKTKGGSFFDYVSAFRIEEAKKLLKETDRPITEIATMCGFASQTSFSRSFKSYVGSSPTEYRNSDK